MRIGVPRETAPGERRVALVPDAVARLVKSGLEVAVEHSAGVAADFPDATYANAGALIVDDASSLYSGATVIVKVRKPSPSEAAQLAPGSILVSLLQPAASAELLGQLVERQVTALALELVPRITRAQSMDVLSSQSTVAGYKAVLLGASMLGKFLPMLTTAAGTIAPAKAFIIGAGVAGLQAIATARRLGAIVSAFDVRPAAKEQVQSLGATFVAAELVAASAEDKGGYATAQDEEQQRRTLEAVAKHIVAQDLVITTALIPGRRAPTLITEEMVRAMKPGSVIVDLAAEAGGNCTLTQPGETVDVGGVTITGPLDLASTVAFHASQMFSKNVLTLLQHLVKDGVPTIDLADEITGAMVVTHAGEQRTR